MRLARLVLAALAAPLALALLATPSAPGAAEAAPPAPTGRARFTTFPRFVEAELSPGGKYLAAVSLQGGRRALVVVKLADRSIASSFNPGGDTMVGSFYWANEERLVMELQDQDGTLAGPVSRGELYAINADGRGGKMVFGYRAGEMQTGSHLPKAQLEYAWAQVEDTLRHDDRNILISTRSMREVGDRQVRLWKLDVYTGLKSQVAVSPVPEADFFTDEDGELRLAAARDANVDFHYYLRDPAADGGWVKLAGQAGFTTASRPVAYVAKDRTIEMWEPLGNGFTFGFYAVNKDTGERKLLARTEVAPPRFQLRDPATRRTVALESEPDLPTWEVLDAAHPLARSLDGLLGAFPGQDVRLVSVTEDGRLALAFVHGDRQPGRWLLVDVASHTAEPVLETFPWIDPAQMAEVQAFHIAASDGFRIHGYLTLPPGLKAGEKPPLVVLPHGGPHFVRDRWGFDPEAQLLASEGFAVLQVNYRGSGGHGRAYEVAGFRKWGDRVIEDVLDATRWAVRKGKVDGARVCAYGASFGGYAAMQAASLAPDLFRCAAGYAGIYDLTIMATRGDISWSGTGRGFVRRAVGEDEAALAAASPARHPEKLTVPVFLAHGGRDQRAPIAHAERLRDALTALGRPPEWLVESTEAHGFYKEEARARLYDRLLAFLKLHTAPKPAPATATPAPPAGAAPPP